MYCETCGKAKRVSLSSTAKFCSSACYGKSLAKPKVERKTIYCEVCGKARETLASNKQAKYCSHECSNIGKIGKKRAKKVTIICAYCRKPFEVYPYDLKRAHCSAECKYLDLKGKSRPDWYKTKMAGRLSNVHNKYNTGYLHLDRLNLTVWCRSSYEKKAFNLFDDLSLITGLDVEKVAIPYHTDDGALHYYHVDCLVHLSGYRNILVEIKPEKMMTNRVNILKFQSATKYANDRGWQFIILNEKHLLDTNSVETMLLKVTSTAKATTTNNSEEIVLTA